MCRPRVEEICTLFEKVKFVHDHLDGLEVEKDEVLKKYLIKWCLN